MEGLRPARKILMLSLVAALLGFGLPSSAHADSCATGDATHLIVCLSVPNLNLATQGTGPYGQLTITGSGTSFTVDALGLNGFVFGDHNIIGLNLTATGTLVAGSGSISPLTQSAAGNVDGFGTFNFILDDGPGFSSPHSSFSFSFTTSVAETLATLLTTTGNGKNADAVAHMALATNTACTGIAANTGANPQSGPPSDAACASVPEPGTLVLFGTGLASVASLFGMRSFNRGRRQTA